MIQDIYTISDMSQETRDSLVQKRSVVKRKITNLIKKAVPLTQKQETTQFDIVCAEQYLNCETSSTKHPHIRWRSH